MKSPKPQTRAPEKVYTSKSDGIYIGLSGQTKRTWEILFGQPIGVVFAAFGQFLMEEWGSTHNAEQRMEMVAKLKEEFNKHGHSGGSALVEVQQLFDLLGARCLTDETRAYLMDLQDAFAEEKQS
jgi:hypothetical protein